jgi:antibiotic biosynthesis monooxygenase (ABM) superfamily enzyme
MIPSTGETPATTVVLSRRIKAGREAEFQAWAEGFHAVMAAYPGHLRGQMVPPVENAQPEWVFIYTFDSPQSLRFWLESEDRRVWLAKAEPLVESQGPAQLISGLEQLFGLVPPTVAPPPPVWKVACSVVAGLFPITILNYLFLAPRLKPLPLVPRAFLGTVIVVGLMTWVVMPGVTRLLRPWLYPKRKG